MEKVTLRLCSSLNIVTALKSCFDYIRLYIPMNRIPSILKGRSSSKRVRSLDHFQTLLG